MSPRTALALPCALALLACSGLAPAPSSPPPDAPAPAAFELGPLAGNWIQTTDHQGKVVVLTRMCATGTPSISLHDDGVSVNWGQEGSSYQIRSIAWQGEDAVLDVATEPMFTGDPGGNPMTISAHRTSIGWDWTIGNNNDLHTTSATSSEMPRFKECCTSSEDEPLESAYDTVPDAEPCPPEPE